MANRHYEINEELEVTLKLKVIIKQCSNYNPLNESQLAHNVKNFKNEIKEHLENKIKDEYYREEVTIGVDDWTYDVE
jgi:uncharacterized protein YaaR (DUF327 family)